MPCNVVDRAQCGLPRAEALARVRPAVDDAPPLVLSRPPRPHAAFRARKEATVEAAMADIRMIGNIAREMSRAPSLSVLERRGPTSLNADKRRRELRRIDAENERLLKRLETAKPAYKIRDQKRSYKESRKHVAIASAAVQLPQLPRFRSCSADSYHGGPGAQRLHREDAEDAISDREGDHGCLKQQKHRLDVNTKPSRLLPPTRAELPLLPRPRSLQHDGKIGQVSAPSGERMQRQSSIYQAAVSPATPASPSSSSSASPCIPTDKRAAKCNVLRGSSPEPRAHLLGSPKDKARETDRHNRHGSQAQGASQHTRSHLATDGGRQVCAASQEVSAPSEPLRHNAPGTGESESQRASRSPLPPEVGHKPASPCTVLSEPRQKSAPDYYVQDPVSGAPRSKADTSGLQIVGESEPSVCTQATAKEQTVSQADGASGICAAVAADSVTDLESRSQSADVLPAEAGSCEHQSSPQAHGFLSPSSHVGLQQDCITSPAEMPATGEAKGHTAAEADGACSDNAGSETDTCEPSVEAEPVDAVEEQDEEEEAAEAEEEEEAAYDDEFYDDEFDAEDDADGSASSASSCSETGRDMVSPSHGSDSRTPRGAASVRSHRSNGDSASDCSHCSLDTSYKAAEVNSMHDTDCEDD